MQVGNLYLSQAHGLIVVRKVSLTHQSMNGSSLYKVVYQVITDGSLKLAHITRASFHDQFTSL
jgi:hypothetical protein